jgi:hypothetical protein
MPLVCGGACHDTHAGIGGRDDQGATNTPLWDGTSGGIWVHANDTAVGPWPEFG